MSWSHLNFKSKIMKNTFLLFVGLSIGGTCFSQSFPGPVGDATTTAVFKEDPRVDYWLEDSVSITRGYVNIDDPSLGQVTYGDVEYALGASDPNVISLGDGGSATYVLSTPIFDQDGYDFAVFENAFDDYFLELAFVEVSTNGIDYVRFPNQSNTDTDEQTGTFAATYTEDIYNLAGKYRAQYGTPFDLEELADSSAIDITNINYIRIVDVVGSINPSYATYDSHGNIINDPWPTPFNSSGFDLDAVAILKPSELHVEEHFKDWAYTDNQFVLTNQNDVFVGQVYDVMGKLILSQPIQGQLSLNHLPNGVYMIKLIGENQMHHLKINVE